MLKFSKRGHNNITRRCPAYPLTIWHYYEFRRTFQQDAESQIIHFSSKHGSTPVTENAETIPVYNLLFGFVSDFLLSTI